MNLSDIEDAMRGNFVWDRSFHRLGTKLMIEKSKTLALVIFCGLAYERGFYPSRIIKYLYVSEKEFEDYLDLFEKYSKRTLYKPRSVGERFVIKISLVRNALGRLH